MKFTIKRPSSLAGFVLAVISLFVLLPMAVHGQELRGKISGRVTDPNGGAVPGAAVKVVDVARNKTIDLTTNGEGLFEAPYLLPGTYQVLVEMSGFKKALEKTVEVAINTTRTVDIKLEIGTPQETVTVTTDAPELNQSDPNLGQTIDRKRVDELPSVHGDPYHL
ncbi:MAG TPA: carboxypeptidase-like regulatory domain-containing protein, partial [Pyrinomonadaceae bacterium]|nr:carboxypeptidase-like regulatory domain-containing protein [Pyrinomonadaceae bacterium]